MRRAIEATILFLMRTDVRTHRRQVLLGKKSASASYGAGLWMPPGGKCKDGEPYVDCVLRETEEEVGVVPVRSSLTYVAELTTYEDGEPFFHVVVFTASAYKGRLTASNEMDPQWHFVDEIPYGNGAMWPSDALWVPRVLSGERLSIRVYMHRDREWGVETEALLAAAV